MERRLPTAWVFAALGFVLAAFHGVVNAQAELNFATAYAVDNFQTRNLQQFADEVQRATNGKLKINVHPAGSLIKPADIFKGVRDGKAEGGEVIMSSLANESAMFGMDSLPFIVAGYPDAQHMWEVSRPAVEKALAERGLKLLYAVPWPPQNLYSRVPIDSVTDFKGLRMRVFSPATERLAQLIQAKPVTIQVVDLGNAIATGQLDLMITSSWTGVETKAWTYLPFYYKASVFIPKNIVFVRQAVFNQLDAQQKQVLADLARRAEERGWKLSESSNNAFEATLAANKVNVATMEFFIRQHLDRVGETIAREWLKQAGPEELQVLLRYTTGRSVGVPPEAGRAAGVAGR